jgi:hypothetical protein
LKLILILVIFLSLVLQRRARIRPKDKPTILTNADLDAVKAAAHPKYFQKSPFPTPTSTTSANFPAHDQESMRLAKQQQTSGQVE